MAQSILLLNASYEPLTVVTLARAVKLLLRGRAEAVSDEHVTVASAARSPRRPASPSTTSGSSAPRSSSTTRHFGSRGTSSSSTTPAAPTRPRCS